MKNVKLSVLHSLCIEILKKNTDFSHSYIEEIIAQFLYAEMRGKRTHGLVRIPWIIDICKERDFRENLHSPIAKSVHTVDCTGELGYIAAKQIAQLIDESMKQRDWQVVIARNIFPTNALGYYQNTLPRNTLSVIFGTTSPLATIGHGSKKILGTNPLAIQIRTISGETFGLDMTTATHSYGEVLVAQYDNTASLHAIHQSLDTSADRRIFALNTIIEILTIILSGQKTSEGDLVLFTCKLDAFTSLNTQHIIEAFELNLSHNDIALPGKHGEAIHNNAVASDVLAIPEKLYETLLALNAT